MWVFSAFLNADKIQISGIVHNSYRTFILIVRDYFTDSYKTFYRATF